MNPVFELEGASPEPLSVRIDGAMLDAERYAWDGHSLWLDATFETPTGLDVQLAATPNGPALPHGREPESNRGAML